MPSELLACQAMYIRWTMYHCPSCGKQWKSRVVTSPRVGPEYHRCSCGYSFRTSDKEWGHMTKGQRIEYFASIWLDCLLADLLCLFGSTRS